MAGGAFAGIAIANNIARLQKWIQAASESWKALEARGLSLEQEEMSVFAAASGAVRPMLSGTTGGCQVEVHIRSDMVHYATTEIAATPPKGIDATVGVHPSPGGVLGYLRSWLGQDIQVGDEAFDEAFLVTGKPESAAKALLQAPIRQLFGGIDRARLAGFTCTKEKVTVLLHGVETDATGLGAAIDLACAAATWTA